MANLQSQIDILAKAVVKEHIKLEEYKEENKGSVSLNEISNEIDVYNTVGEINGGGVKVDYKDESYELNVTIDDKTSTTTMFTYDEDHDFSGFLFYDEENKYVVNDNGEIVSSNSLNFHLESDTFARRINLNEGEIGDTQIEKNKKRMVYIGEIAETRSNNMPESYYNLDTLRIIKSDVSQEWVGQYCIEFNKSELETILLIIEINEENISDSSITYPFPGTHSYNIVTANNTENIVGKEVDTLGLNFNIMDNDNLIYAYRSRNINTNEFENNSTTLLGVHLAPGVKFITDSVFNNCSGLTGVMRIPYGIDILNDYVFNMCGIEQVTIPNSVTTILDYAFGNCTRLTQITIPNTVAKITEFAFNNSDNIETIIVTGCNDYNKVDNTIKTTFKINVTNNTHTYESDINNNTITFKKITQ